MRRGLRAALYSLAVVGAIVVVFFLLVLVTALFTDTGRPVAEQLAYTMSAAFGGLGIGLAAAAVLLFALTLAARNRGSWAFAWRAIAAGYAIAVIGPMTNLLRYEWIPNSPGAAGDFASVVVSTAFFTFLGGPIWVGLIGALLRGIAGPEPKRDERANASALRSIAGWLVIAGALLAFGTIAATSFDANHGSADYRCLGSTPPPHAEVIGELPSVSPRVSYWPLGVECVWQRDDGSGTIGVNRGNWGTTAIAGLGLVASLTGIGILIPRARKEAVAAVAAN